MPCKFLPIALLVLLFTNSLCFADTFIVTSNADSGPGTLRDAIEKANANGIAVTDYIHFNIPQAGYTQRVIDLVSELPGISSKIVIDGTTQPTAAYGTTDARVCLRRVLYSPFFSMLKVENARGVQIYGMHLYYGYWQGFFGVPYRSSDLFGINITRSSDVTIGAPGKGNVISGVVHSVFSNSDGCSDIKIRSNFLGHERHEPAISYEVDANIAQSECGITLANVKDIFIGGPLPAEGNIFGSRHRAITIDSKNSTGNGLIRIQQNLFARNFDKTSLINTYDFWSAYISIGRSRNNPVVYSHTGDADYRVEILDNNIPNSIGIANTTDSVIVLRNRFDVDGRTHGSKMGISSPGGGIIGGDDDANANHFLNKKPGPATYALVLYNTGPITIRKNIFICNSNFGSTVEVVSDAGKAPVAQVDLTTTTGVSGRGTPNSRIDLYHDDECTACEGKAYLATVKSDPTGKWTYAGAITGTVIATAHKNGYTGAFSAPTFDYSAMKVRQPVCGLNNGSITNIKTEGAETFFWLDAVTGDTVGKSKDLLNAGPGQYQLFGVHGGTCIKPMNSSITLQNITPSIYQQPSKVNPSCGLSNGSFYGMIVTGTGNSKMEWKDEAGQVVGTNVDVSKLPGGRYTFYATDTTAGCIAVSPTYELINLNGPSLETSGLKIMSTTCGKQNGSISGISAVNVTGSSFTQWIDAAGKVVGSGFSLMNAAAGTYRFKFKDQGNCDTITRTFTINPLTSFTPISITASQTTDASCDLQNGLITLQSFSVNPADYTFRWIEVSSGNLLGNSSVISNLAPGNYQLFATDNKGCDSMIFGSIVKKIPKPVFDYSGIMIKNDECNQGLGAILSLKTDGLTSPARYTWLNEQNTPVGNANSLQGVPQGNYQLELTAGNCTITSKPLTVLNKDNNVPAPVYADLVIPRHSGAALDVKNRSQGNYKVFADAGGLILRTQNTTGNFNIGSISQDTVLYIQHQVGTCVSPVVRVSVKVVDKSFFTIPNAFTPNKDGVNDRLNVRVSGSIQLSYFRVYNRWGQLVFETAKSGDGWDGNLKGLLQPAGTYAWIAVGKDLLGNIIKDNGSFVLIR